MRIKNLMLLASWLPLLLATGQSQGQEAPSGLARGVHELPGAIQKHLDARSWRLDSAVFTEIRPFTVPDIAIQLPIEQRDELPVETAPLVPVPALSDTEASEPQF